jgi:hypothetical protein
MYKYGGIYIDLDFIGVKNLEPLLDRDVLLVFEAAQHSQKYDGAKRRLFNGFFGSEPKNDFWLKWMDYVVEKYDKKTWVHKNTGPSRFGIFYDSYPEYFNDDWFIDTCNIMPFSHYKDDVYYADDCDSDSDIYTYTTWIDGTAYNLTLKNQFEHFGNILRKTNKKYKEKIAQHYHFILCIILIFILAIYI